ncbi:DUF4297 family anti-phage-associated protein [Niastella sp. OAS944]|uniref:DUF4297 family anti-phage-associated protein n=1 Tax=Niastella sp. OAS944 TaxID=2664089 RepID=UPI003479A71E|nr:hypothetical protein [Chitinophagaceae bacterium OAS944]
MRDRAAIDTIKGYFYQFDYSIFQMLNLQRENDTITIEGIEDVDLETASEATAIQCKYYSKTEYNHSVIAEPIRHMLDHFAEVKKGKKPKINYKIRGCYKSGQNKLNLPLTVKDLKDNFLIYRKQNTKHEHHSELGLDDLALSEFISCLEVDVNAKDFDMQFQDLIKSIVRIFKCSNFSAEYFYYNNALRVVKDLAVQPIVDCRKISKKDFFNRINTKKILFNEWFISIKGEKLYFQSLRKEYFSVLNISSFERFFLLEIDSTTYSRSELKHLLFSISRKWSKLSAREPKPFCPYVYMHGISTVELFELKKELISEDFLFWDGFDFEGAKFNPKSIVRRADNNNKIKLKIINSIDFISLIVQEISFTKEIYQFYLKDSFFSCTNSAIKHIQIQVSDLSKINNII